MFLSKKNNARTVINQTGGINASTTSMTVADASQLPSSSDFVVTIWDNTTHPDPSDDSNSEIVKVTGISGNILTIERGQEDTIGKAHANGQAVQNLITAGTFEEIEDAINILSPGQQVDNEELTSQVDGLTDSFTTLFNYVAGTLKIYVGGY